MKSSRIISAVAGLLLTWGCKPSTYDQELAESLRENDALNDCVTTILQSAQKGEIKALLVQNLPQKTKAAVLTLIPDENAHVVIESNEFAHGVFIFYGPRVDTGLCVFSGNAGKLSTGHTRTTISSNVFVFQRLGGMH